MEISANKRLAKNTLVLYLRMIIVILVNLYASRVILSSLGEIDYGIYNVVGGIVAMFIFLNTAMVASSQRFIAFEQGHSDIKRQRSVFSTSVLIHLLIAGIVLVAAETIGLWFLNHKMNIPENRMVAANWVYQATIICFIFKVVIVPETSSVVAHERMGLYAFASIVFALLQLGVALLIEHFGGDRLIFYALLLIAVELVNFLIYKFYCLRNFEECHYSVPKDKVLFKEMLSFAGWSFVGNFGIAMRGPGVNVVINLFCGPAVNAARGLAYQVSSVVSNFVNNFQMSLTPQITKDYALGDDGRMMKLVMTGSRISCFLLAFIVVPLYIRAGDVLSIWLEEVPQMTEEFLKLVLLVSLVGSMVGPITTALQATGKIKTFQISIAIIMLLELPLAYGLMTFGVKAYHVVYVSLFIELLALVARIILLNAQIKLDLRAFFIGILGKCLLVCALMFSLPLLLDRYIGHGFWNLVLLSFVSVAWSCLVVLSVGLTQEERRIVFNFIKKKI